MTSADIRRSFLDFFRERGHTIVPSSSLLPDSPNLLFTNAGMNQFVPIFLGQAACQFQPPRAADTQKCIRAGGKHNDLDDVGIDTYHHTFFEMLGNWSFGDYFKKEAIAWAWELIVERWGFPAGRLYATVYSPEAGDPSEFDNEAFACWSEHFSRAGLDPGRHIVHGGRKDNFWMMGDTGPCGPCSELHVDLTPEGATQGSLVNRGDPRCIEIWNLVFIQFNADPDGGFSPLPSRHVDTGMGFERVTSVIQGTRNFTDFTNARISNYETDIFRPIFEEIERLTGTKYGSTLPPADLTALTSQQSADIAYRVIADHIRTLSFAIADGIAPGNTDRHYVLRRILRRAVRYGRALGLNRPFFHRLAGVLAGTMGDVFPELRAGQARIEEVLLREEEAFNRTLDKGISLFNAEAARISGERGLPAREPGARYSKRRLPHYERPHGIYHITFGTRNRRVLSPAGRSAARDAVVHFDQKRYDLFALCVMPDHVHVLFRPWIKDANSEGLPVFWPLGELMHSIKSYSAGEINRLEGTTGEQVWENEYHDRLMRSDAEVEEKFLYICRNPSLENLVEADQDYPWLWTWDQRELASAGRQDAGPGGLEARAPQISGEFAFRLYDEQGFPLDLTELMARERGLTVDVEGFERLMEEQRARARAAQRKEVITVSEENLRIEPTKFLGYDFLETEAVVEGVVIAKEGHDLLVDRTAFYAEMGGQVGDSGLVHVPGPDRTEAGRLRIVNTFKQGPVFVHRMVAMEGRLPEIGEAVRLAVDAARRAAIQRHHTVTHLLHWALHEVAGADATQKGSYVGPEKLTFDFNSAPLEVSQVREIERLVNERVLESAPVTWREVPHADVKARADIMQFFGDKYGDTVRVVQIGGRPGALDGFSMELCAGTHTRSTGEIGLFRIVAESAIAAGVRRIEAVAGLEAFAGAVGDSERLRRIAATLGSPLAEVERKLELLVARQRELEKALKAARQREASAKARELAQGAETIGGIPAIIADLGSMDGALVEMIAETLKGSFAGVAVLGSAPDSVVLAASAGPHAMKKFHAGKIIQAIAPVVGGKGGGRPESARGGGRDASKLAEALAAARALLSSS